MLALLVAGPGLALRGGAPPLRSPLPCRRPAALRMMTEVECDVVIVGGGPAGMTCALYTARADHKTVVLDKNPAVGALAITSHIANYPGVDKSMTGAELLDQMRNQAVEYGTDYRRGQVFGIDALDSGEKYVYTPDATYKARALVLATGAMGRPPSYAALERLERTPSCRLESPPPGRSHAPLPAAATTGTRARTRTLPALD